MSQKEYYHDIDLNKNQLFNSRVHNISTGARIVFGATLTTADKGLQVYDTDLLSPFFWDGVQWASAGGGGGAVWGSITGTVTAQTDLTAYLTANYYPLSTNPANYLTSFTEVDPVFNTWLTTTPPLYSFTETDPIWTADKPSYLTSAAAALVYEPIISAGTSGQYWRGDKTWQTFPTIPTVGTWGALNYPSWTTGTPFVKMTAAGTFSLDTNTYLTSITSLNVTTALGYTPVTNARNLTINGTTYDLTADRTWTISAGVTGSGVATRVAFWDGTSSLSSNANLYWDNTNSWLGIGNIVPIAPIDLGSGTGTAGSINKLALYSSPLYGTYGFGISAAQLDYVSGGSHVFYSNSPTTSELFRIGGTGTLTSLSLVGSGTRMVTTSSTGVISSQAIPSGGGSVGFEMNFMLMGA